MDKEQSKVITKHLKEFRKIKGLFKDDVARSLGVSKNYIKELEKNQVIIDDTMLSKIIEAYRFDINQIINQEYDEEDDEYYYRVPVLGKVQCGLPIIAQDYIDTYKYLPMFEEKLSHRKEEIKSQKQLLFFMYRYLQV